ncbi:hypothetical protein ACFFK0_03550 [Paenibacillus chartarius]|uniref:Uncharacterized protein n=1 Tax=Paenibacillus chartarius TaxID=747481 RepID=A0ABV6DFW6_9BACL
MKKQHTWKWILFGAGALIVIGAAYHFLWSGGPGYGPRTFGRGHGGGMSMMPHGIRGGRGGFGGQVAHGFGTIRFLSWLLPLMMLVGGALLWKKAKDSSFVRIVGMSFAAAGLLLLTPPVIGIPIVLVGAYLAYRMNRQPAPVQSYAGQAEPLANPMYTENVNNAKLLDEWEQQAMKEDN